MLFRGRLRNDSAALSHKDTSVSLAVGEGWVSAWDLGGRLYSIWKNGHTFRRGLTGQVLHKWRDDTRGALNPYDARHRVRLEGAEADALVDEAAARAAEAADRVARFREGWRDGSGGMPGADVEPLLARCAAFDARAAREDAERFAAVYRPIGMLPPDQYLSVVLQATEGCSFGSCTFCDLYDRPYRVKSPADFARHADEVKAYLGESISLRRRSIFLGAANAIAIPMPRLVELFGVLSSQFDLANQPVHAFVDGFTGTRKGSTDYSCLHALGLRRIYVGLESGHDPLLAFVRKPATRTQAVEAVHAMKEGGVSVGVIVMIGLGGHRYSAAHVADTVDAVNAMGLGAGDVLYFSDLVEVPGTAYPGLAAAHALDPLDLDARLAQLAAIRSALVFGATAPQLARYDVREFIY
ncbi:MAG TPA: radical SAM protein [Vicinamibacterales bacterium]|jgi:hypothetical protein